MLTGSKIADSTTTSATVTVPNLFEPNTAYEKRRNQVDFRLAKTVRAGKARYVGFCNMPAWQVMKALALADRMGLPRFVYAIDWGNFFFLTRPIFLVLNFFHGLLGNVGLAILAALIPAGIPPWPWADHLTAPALVLAAAAWSMAFGLYLWKYAPILLRPRPDGRDG